MDTFSDFYGSALGDVCGTCILLYADTYTINKRVTTDFAMAFVYIRNTETNHFIQILQTFCTLRLLRFLTQNTGSVQDDGTPQR